MDIVMNVSAGGGGSGAQRSERSTSHWLSVDYGCTQFE